MSNGVLDFSGGYPSPQSVKDGGYEGVLLYLSLPRTGTNFPGKRLTKGVVDGYAAAGVKIGFLWQLGKRGDPITPEDSSRGFVGGQVDAQYAEEKLAEVGCPGAVVYAALDYDCNLFEWNDVAADYWRGWNAVIGLGRTGIYGHSRAMSWSQEDGVASWFMQTRAWSGQEVFDDAHLYQSVVDTPTNPGPKVDGVVCDVNEVLRPEWGYYKFATTPPTEVPSMSIDPQFTINRNDGGTNGRRSRTDWVGIHTSESNSKANNLANYCVRAGVSYNALVDDKESVRLVADANSSWSAVEANGVAAHVCASSSFASWSRGKWLETDESDGINENKMLSRMARVVAYYCQEFNVPPERVVGVSGWPQKRGVTGHVDFGQRGGGHTDPGAGFPWDVLVERVNALLVPPQNMIDAAAARASSWIGKRTHEGERDTWDATGRWADFENGRAMYKWGSPAAYVIPKGGLFEAYAARGYEKGPLGFPVHDFTKLPEGAVMAFEKGTLLRKDGAPDGYFVTGAIQKRYAELGWETSQLGYPTSDEAPNIYDETGRSQSFEKGSLLWHPSGVSVSQ